LPISRRLPCPPGRLLLCPNFRCDTRRKSQVRRHRLCKNTTGSVTGCRNQCKQSPILSIDRWMDQSTRPTNLPLFDIICKTTTDLPIMILIALATLVLAVCSVVTPVKAAGSTCTPTTPQDSANTARKLPSFLAFPPYDSQQYSRQASESSDPLLCSTIYGGGADWFVGYCT